MTWLNNSTNNEFQIRSKLDIDITKFYWDGNPYTVTSNFTYAGYPGIIPLRSNNKKIICGDDFISMSSPSLAGDVSNNLGNFAIDLSTLDLSLYTYMFKINFNYSGFKGNSTDLNVSKNNSSDINYLKAGLKNVFFQQDLSWNPSNFLTIKNILNNSHITTGTVNTTNYVCNLQILQPFMSDLVSQNQGTATLLNNNLIKASLSNFSSLNSLFSINKINEKNFFTNTYTDETLTSNNYSSDKIQPVNHCFFDLLLTKEYSREWASSNSVIGVSSSSFTSDLNTTIITGNYDNSLSTIKKSKFYFPYMSFFICNPLPFAFKTDNINFTTDKISNVEIEITRIPR